MTCQAHFLPLVALAFQAPTHQDPPADEKRGLVRNEPGAFAGYTLFTPLRSKVTVLVDMEGTVVHEWQHDLAPGGGVYLLENGDLLRLGRISEETRFGGGGIGGRLQRFTWEGELVWDYPLGDDYLMAHHDMEPLPNGNVIVIAWEHRFREDAIAFGRDPDAIGEEGMWPDSLLELKPLPPDGAEVVWEWHVWDHLVQDFDEEKEGYGAVAEHPELVDINADHRDAPPVSEEEKERLAELEEEMRALGYVGGEEQDANADGGMPDMGSVPDWLHTNAVDWHPEHDLLILSTPTMNEVWVIDHSLSTEDAAWNDGGRFGKGGSLLYRYGNPRNYGAGDAADRRFFYQHDPKWVLDGSGELRFTLFNNGGGRPDGDYSAVEEYVLDFDPSKGFRKPPGKPFGPEGPAWSYAKKGDFYSGFISGAQRLPNGNTLICSGAPGRVFEVTREGTIVWEYLNPFLGDEPIGRGGNAPPTALFRAERYPEDHPAFAGRGL